MSVPLAPSGSDPQEIPVGMLQAAMSEAHLVLHGPPDFPLNAEILGVCGVSIDNADQNKYGWMVADFLNWKMLFQQRPTQTWLSSLDISKFLASVAGVDMANDGIIDTVIGNHKDGILTISSDNKGFEATFLQRLAASACSAVSRKTILVVMVFAPITPEQDICVDFGGRTYLTAERLRDTISDAIGDAPLPVMLVTPSPFTGGWLCRPSFMGRPVHPTPDKMMRTIAKSCGGASAHRFIHLFTKRNTPIMTEAQRQKVKYDDPMPIGPTELQTDCLHKFWRQIHESLEQRHSVFALDHALILEPEAARDSSSFSDAWVEYGPRRGRSLEFWAGRLRSSRPTIAETDRFEFLGEAFGGTRESQFFHLKYLSAIELDTCPGDWARYVGGIAHELYTSFGQRLMVSEDDAKRVFDTIEFRASSMILAHMIAKAFSLPLPDGVKGRYWHDRNHGVGEDYYRKLQAAFGEAHNLFDEVAMLPSENRHGYKDVRFVRAARWLSAAIALRFESRSKDEIKKFVLEDIARFIAKIRGTQKALLVEDQAVRRTGLDWIAALGLGEAQIAALTTAVLEVTPARKSSVLDATAAPWPINAGEGKSATKSPAASFTEAESSLAQSDVHHAVEDLLDDFDIANNEHDGTQSLAPVRGPRPQQIDNAGFPIHRIGGSSASVFVNGSVRPQETPVNQVATSNGTNGAIAASPIASGRRRTWSQILRPSSTSNSEQEKPTNMTATSGGTDGKTATTPIANDRASSSNQVANTSPAPNREQEMPANMTATSDSMEGGVAVSSIANHGASTWDQAPNTSSATDREQEEPTNMAATSNGMDGQADTSPIPNHRTRRTWSQILRTPSAPKREQVDNLESVVFREPSADPVTHAEEQTHIPSAPSETMVDESSASCTAAAVTQSPIRQALERLTDGMLAESPNDSLNADAMYLAKVLKQAIKLISNQQSKVASGPESEIPAAEKASSSAQTNGNTNETSGDSTATSWDPVQDTGAVNESVEHSTEIPTALSSAPSAALGISRQTATGHSRIDSLNHRMESLTINDSTPPRPPVAGQRANMEPTQRVGNAGAARPAAAQGTVGANRAAAAPNAQVSLVENEDFFARAGIQW